MLFASILFNDIEIRQEPAETGGSSLSAFRPTLAASVTCLMQGWE